MASPPSRGRDPPARALSPDADADARAQAAALVQHNGELLAVMPATNIGADVQPQTLYQYAKPPQTAYMMAYREYMADPAHKALIKALPPITLPDGSSTRRGIDKTHFAGVWATMDPDTKAVYRHQGAIFRFTKRREELID